MASDLDSRTLDMVLDRRVSKSLNRAAAPVLTVAFETRKADRLSRGEKVDDEQLKKEVLTTYYAMLATTEPDVAVAEAQKAARAKQ